MTRAPFQLHPVAGALRSFWVRGGRVERAGYVIGLLLLASGLGHLAILIAAGGSWAGPLSLRKPATFGLSFGLTLITVTWVTSFLPLNARVRALLLGAFTGASILETALITLQTWRGVPSHFNVETSFDALVARMLAGGGAALIGIIIAFTIAAFRANPIVPKSLRVAIQFGFITLLGSLAVGALMIARGMALVFGGNPQAAYVTGGMLTPTHAVTLHGIVVLPALAWLLSFAHWSEQRRLTVVSMAAGGYLAVIGAVAVGNIGAVDKGRLPIVAPLALGALLLLASAVWALIRITRAPEPHGIQHP